MIILVCNSVNTYAGENSSDEDVPPPPPEVEHNDDDDHHDDNDDLLGPHPAKLGTWLGNDVSRNHIVALTVVVSLSLII